MEKVGCYVKGIKLRTQRICESQNISDEKSKYCVYSGIVHWEMSREIYPLKAMLKDHVLAHKCGIYNMKCDELVRHNDCEIAMSLHQEIGNIKSYWDCIRNSYHQF